MASENHKQYVRTDEHGVLRVAQTRVMLDSVVARWHEGASPETIRQDYPSLSLEEVYGAITWCLAFPDELKQYLQRQDKVWEESRRRCAENEPPMVKRLRKLKAAQSKDK